MDAVLKIVKAAPSFAAPICTALYGIVKSLISMIWTAVLSLSWGPTLTLARNPATALVVGVMMIGSYLAGDFVSYERNHAKIAEMARAHAADLREHDKKNAALLIAEKAKDAEELDALRKQVNSLEAKLKGKPAAAASTKVKAAPAQKAFGLF